jgi:hypothetical protein
MYIGQKKIKSTTEASLLQIYFKSAEFSPKILQQQLTTFDFVSYCGGSLGLFLGFSALSAIELVYYFTIRIVFRRIQRNKVASSSEEVAEPKKRFIVEYLGSSSIHGCNQIVAPKRSKLERCFWIFCVTVALVSCLLITRNSLMKYRSSPITMKYDDVLDSWEDVS